MKRQVKLTEAAFETLKRIRVRLYEHKIGQKKLANAMRCSVDYINRVLNGRTHVSDEQIAKINRLVQRLINDKN
ncbi:helix-turn-helix transcriptional regulator [bacterium]|nr:helix-turn-helix transcriptional regulator [bacterium]